MSDQFKSAQRRYDSTVPPEYFEKETHEIFDSIPSIYSKSEIMESWLCTILMTKLATSGVYTIDLGEFSGSGSTKDEALKDLCEQITEAK
jgi:hypothetical protein